MEIEILNQKGEKKGTVEVPEKVFGVTPRSGFLHEAVMAHLANQRRGTASTKTRSEVSGGGKKPWKQKHTGRARAGSNRSPLWRKGGVVFGPKPRSYRQDFSKTKAMLALAQALTAKRLDGKLIVLDSLEVAEPKTKQVAQIVKALKLGPNTYVATGEVAANLKTAARNIQGLSLGRGIDLNAYEVISSKQLVLTKTGLDALVARYN